MELHELQQIVESNSRAIQALTDDIAELKLIVATDHEQFREERAELRRTIVSEPAPSETVSKPAPLKMMSIIY